MFSGARRSVSALLPSGASRSVSPLLVRDGASRSVSPPLVRDGASRSVSLLLVRDGASRTLSDEPLDPAAEELRGAGDTTVPEPRRLELTLGVEIRGAETLGARGADTLGARGAETLGARGQIYNYCRYLYDISLQKARARLARTISRERTRERSL